MASISEGKRDHRHMTKKAPQYKKVDAQKADSANSKATGINLAFRGKFENSGGVVSSTKDSNVLESGDVASSNGIEPTENTHLNPTTNALAEDVDLGTSSGLTNSLNSYLSQASDDVNALGYYTQPAAATFYPVSESTYPCTSASSPFSTSSTLFEAQGDLHLSAKDARIKELEDEVSYLTFEKQELQAQVDDSAEDDPFEQDDLTNIILREQQSELTKKDQEIGWQANQIARLKQQLQKVSYDLKHAEYDVRSSEISHLASLAARIMLTSVFQTYASDSEDDSDSDDDDDEDEGDEDGVARADEDAMDCS